SMRMFGTILPAEKWGVWDCFYTYYITPKDKSLILHVQLVLDSFGSSADTSFSGLPISLVCELTEPETAFVNAPDTVLVNEPVTVSVIVIELLMWHQ
ncbi:hypothetical protein Tco_0741673, partial [Tanacetum coccineum]